MWPSRLPTPAATKPVKKVPATGDATSGAFALLAVAGLVVAGTAVKVRK
ncbi:MAG: LPXTG cell wall anchor domain-containing protein [Paratractidigestivibacter faecalis]|nr:LPXTG cell wall anchor domain-containing protein [Paratractidigestivibacter faecalis]MCI6507497.1 LPXTG cell wall anchor domain-containing protein [Olsenella sp.]MDY6014008.1 LPXTG cell wall anchor domain-containing protein [Paratractidigestivibacter faecalis]